MHRASCTLNDASLHRLHFSMMQSYDVSPRWTPFNKDEDEDTDQDLDEN